MLSPTDTLACAHVLLARRLVSSALSMFAEAEQAGAEADACAAGRWQCCMLLGQYEQAWAASRQIEARQRATGNADPLHLWDGEPLAGKHVMLRCLHGFGDALQFIRYAPLIRVQAASLCVEAHPKLVPLLGACDGVEQVIPWGPNAPARPPVWNSQIEIMELPRIFLTTTATVPATVTYLQHSKLAESHAAQALARRIERSSGDTRLHCGFSWRASEWDPLRSVPLRQLAHTFAGLPNAKAYSLQHEAAAELAEARLTNIEIIDGPLAEVAACIASLDVVVTIDGVLAHIAGALGKPVLLLLPFAADWRWSLAANTPWYPLTQIFRQQRPGDWSQPTEQAREVLRHLTSA